MIAILLFLAVLIPFYKRYIPVRNIPCVSLESLDRENTVVLDIRDYNVSDKNEVREAIKLPLAYINRNSKDIPSNRIYLVVSNHLEKNLGIRLLRKKGFHVVGFTFSDCNCP